MDEQKQQVIDSLKQANNILVTVKRSPSIDQLAACIALTLILDDQGKHGTAVFSGEVPSVLEFLEPGKTLEKNTDSLQDFIISLDKSKADKLRYKVEDSVVRIFITPYKTSISDKDLEFGQGDFNVDVVVALGVHNQDDLDEAITSHGRILHDATVISMNTDPGDSEDLGSINWIDTDASSLSEMVAGMANSLAKSAKKKHGGDDKDEDDDDDDRKADVIDNQIATALLTGIVAETERFGNAKTTPATMEAAARLLTAGANQELVATKLAEPHKAHATESHEEQDEHQEHGDDNKHEDTDDDRHEDEPKDEDAHAEHDEHGESDGALMPSLIQSSDSKPNEPGHVAKSIYEADEDDANKDEKDDDGTATTDLSDPDKPAGDGSIDITHPDESGAAPMDDGSAQTIDHHDDLAAGLSEPSDPQTDLALAHAGTSIDMPQPADTGLVAPLAPAQESPAPASEAAPAVPTIQPARSHGMIIAPPSHEDESGGGSPDVPSTSAETELPSGSSYGLAPPMMGGTLTSNSTDDPSSHGEADPKESQPAMLTHSQPDFGPLTAPLQQTANHAAAPPADAAPAASSILVAPLTATPTTAAPTAPGGIPPTLAEIEKNTHSPHAATMDMPAPSLTPLLQPSLAAPAPMIPPAMPLPPTPPPLTPPISA